MKVPNESDRPARKRRSDGERSRNAILRTAAQLATVEGIGGLSIGRLAEAVGMSKSGLFAHFGSKEELQLATIAAAHVFFDEQVIDPALEAPTGIDRLHALVENYLKHIQDGVYPGGCFFASVTPELDTAAMMLANAMFVISPEPTPIERARRSVARLLAGAAPSAS
jgi:AcrR family transcriptional regulator